MNCLNWQHLSGTLHTVPKLLTLTPMALGFIKQFLKNKYAIWLTSSNPPILYMKYNAYFSVLTLESRCQGKIKSATFQK